MWASRNKSGFTIVELLIVVALIAILAAITIVSFGAVQRNAIDKSVMSDAEKVAGEITRYSVKNSGAFGAAVVWYSGGAPNANINFTPSPGNIIDVVAGDKGYCIRTYNLGSNHTSLANAFTKGSPDNMCDLMPASVAAGGQWTGDLAGWWPMNGNAHDASGNTITASEVIGATLANGQNGQANSAYAFNGASDYIKLGVSNAVGSLTKDLTVTVWVNIGSVSGARVVLAASRANSANGISLSTNGAQPRFTTYGVKDYDGSSTTLSTGTWYFLAAAMAGNNVNFYVNGSFVQTVTHTAEGRTNLDDIYQIGASTGNGNATPGAFFQGTIDDLRVYKRTLTSGEIATMYSGGSY